MTTFQKKCAVMINCHDIYIITGIDYFELLIKHDGGSSFPNIF